MKDWKKISGGSQIVWKNESTYEEVEVLAQDNKEKKWRVKIDGEEVKRDLSKSQAMKKAVDYMRNK